MYECISVIRSLLDDEDILKEIDAIKVREAVALFGSILFKYSQFINSG